MIANMKRREFITLLGGAGAWPLAAQAQQGAIPVVGFLRSTPRARAQNLVVGFGQGLKEAGFVEGQNVAVDYRYADNQIDRLPALVADLIRRPVAVIVGDIISTIVARHATMTVPIVFVTGGGAVRNGLVASLNRPGANVTGVSFFSAELGSKRLELLHQLVPKATTIAMLADPDTPTSAAERMQVQTAAQTIRQQLIILDASSDADIESAFVTIVQRQAGAAGRGWRVLELTPRTDRRVGGSP